MFLRLGLVRSLPHFFGARAIGGMSASNVSVAKAYVADISGHGLAPQGWMIYAIIVMNLLAFGVGATINALVSRRCGCWSHASSASRPSLHKQTARRVAAA